MARKWINPAGTSTYYSWRSMRQRCTRPTERQLERYREMQVYEPWFNSYDEFFKDMGPRPEGCTLDRIDNTLGYFPENCRWADIVTQNNNKATNRMVAGLDGRKMSVTQWERELGLRPTTVSARLRRGLPLDKVLFDGKLKQWKHGTRYGYEKYKCRCDACREAHNKRFRDRRLKLKVTCSQVL